LSLILLGA
jgi:hypothetical protein